ncbi:membrane protein insertion efficiency factor YidD [candidate division CPR3 bacterium 4484_211]|uniref:Putative membrane protein insertion efficiency factor n=1 Tax=candidate division CPR3 bacterium 4484_211 TaxID=1968527 RepID=A0A1W9NXD3_UNCC3|nr:MAG: membrane protein insertion efficiency factor YidD [candidate division CPR3 bacterium 4484_211]
MKNIVLKLIRVYQQYFSGCTHWLARSLGFFEAGCKFTPRCSKYAYQAVDKYGLVKGGWLGLMRIVRCHPWSRGGSDPLR